MNWYYLNDAGEVAGPVSDSTLVELRSINRLTDNAQVCREGSEDWISLAEALGAVRTIPRDLAGDAAPSRQLAPKKKSNSRKGVLIAMIGGVMIAAGAATFFLTQGGNPELPDQPVSKIEASEDSKKSAGKSEGQFTSNTFSNDGKSNSSKEKASSEEVFQHGLRYFNGEKFPGEAALKEDVESKDLDHALKLFLQAAEAGHAEAQYYAAVCYGAAVPPKMEEAKRWMQESANQGLTKAQYLLGVGYISGDFGDKDETKGLSLISKAADGHYADAQWFLGLRHLRGEGVSLDEKRAAALLLKAAEQDHAQACYDLGVCYEKGIGVENDPNKASNWLAKAWLLTQHLPKNQILSSEHPLRVSDPEKQAEYGIAYIQGKDQVISKKNAFYLFQKSAQRDNPRGQYCLGLAYSRGDGVEKDDKLALEWFKKSAEQGNQDAQHNLGFYYEIGNVVVEDPKVAAKWYAKAAIQDQKMSQRSLAWMYMKGLGVSQNSIISNMLFILSESLSMSVYEKNKFAEFSETISDDEIRLSKNMADRWESDPNLRVSLLATGSNMNLKGLDTANAHRNPMIPTTKDPINEAPPKITAFRAATLDEARECVRLLDEQLKQDPGNTRIQKVKNTIMEIFREETSLVQARSNYQKAEKLLLVEQRNLAITSKPSGLTGRVNQNEVAKTRGKVNAAQTAMQSEKTKGEITRSNLQKLLNEALSELPEEEREALSPVWRQVARRNQITIN